MNKFLGIIFLNFKWRWLFQNTDIFFTGLQQKIALVFICFFLETGIGGILIGRLDALVAADSNSYRLNPTPLLVRMQQRMPRICLRGTQTMRSCYRKSRYWCTAKAEAMTGERTKREMKISKVNRAQPISPPVALTGASQTPFHLFSLKCDFKDDYYCLLLYIIIYNNIHFWVHDSAASARVHQQRSAVTN